MAAFVEQRAPKQAGVSRAKLAALFMLGVGLLAGLVWLLPWAESVRFAQGVELLSARVSEEASDTEPVEITLRFLAGGPIDEDALVLAHWSGTPLTCSGFVHQPPSTPSRRWQAGTTYTHTIRLPVPAACALGELELFASLYLPHKAAPLPVLRPAVEFDRVHIGTSQVVDGHARGSARELTGRALARRALLAPLLAWLPWLLGIVLTTLFALLARSTITPRDQTAPAVEPRLTWLLRALPIATFLVGIALVLEFIKDDAYISFRYAHNLVHGAGLVFNRGERVEGITNFLWTLLLAPFEALRIDLFRVSELLGVTLGAGCLIFVARLTALLQARERWLGSELWGAWWLASSSSFVLYAHSGLEQPLAALLPCAGAFTLYTSRDLTRADPNDKRAERGHLLAGLLLGAACITRPELHVASLLVALPVLVDAVRTRSMSRALRMLALGVLLLTVPAHLFRYVYYGSLIPNTFYVKTSSDSAIWRLGINTLRELFGFNHTGLLLVLAPLAFLDRRRSLEKLSCLAIAIFFLLYYARVGVDEMTWHRLYIPALPFACALAAAGAQNLLLWLGSVLRGGVRVGASLVALTWLCLAFWAYDNLSLTHAAWNGFDGYGSTAGTYHPDLGKFLVRHERPGGLVAFQDMGATPYYAPDLSFLDFVGLVDARVAHARHEHGLHAYIDSDSPAQSRFDAEMREYFFERNPDWTILTIFGDAENQEQIGQLFSRDPTGASFGHFYKDNNLQFGLWDDARFHERYVPVRTWRRSWGYYLALWRRRDLWQKTPGEVVVARPPPRMTNVEANFEGGLKLLGAALAEAVEERSEAFVTTWWQLPGALPRDLMFSLHFERAGSSYEASSQHVPGDWMYPADRWQAGQILEDRTLFQLPPRAMRRGTYQVYVSAHRRETGERLKVTSQASDNEGRVRIGTLEVERRLPALPLIPRTDVVTMRAHPERIPRP